MERAERQNSHQDQGLAPQGTWSMAIVIRQRCIEHLLGVEFLGGANGYCAWLLTSKGLELWTSPAVP